MEVKETKKVDAEMCDGLIKLFNSPDQENSKVAMDIMMSHFNIKKHLGYIGVIYLCIPSTIKFLDYFYKKPRRTYGWRDLVDYLKTSKDEKQKEYVMKKWRDNVTKTLQGIYPSIDEVIIKLMKDEQKRRTS